MDLKSQEFRKPGKRLKCKPLFTTEPMVRVTALEHLPLQSSAKREKESDVDFPIEAHRHCLSAVSPPNLYTQRNEFVMETKKKKELK